ncbi:MAG: hypothetical protein JWQ02_1599 [Capsulimonas sp.]|nr:hypothetical protein [Capsulimonas sp.]
MQHRSIHSVLLLCLALASPAAKSMADAPPFVHPGLLHTRADLERMKLGVASHESPIAEGFAVFAASPESQSSYVLRGPFSEIGRNPSVHFGEFDTDANAAYQCALMWAITGDRSYADKSEQIIDAWSGSLKTVSGADAVLMAGLGPFKMVNAAEILRYTDSKWSAAEIDQCERMFRSAIYPTLKDFALFANGNWDTAAVKTVIAIGVFCNDRPMFERALHYYIDGAGDGRLTHYISATGQCQESGRDQGHTQLGLAHLGDCCEIAWSQGLDLYAYADNRLLKGFEYTAKYNLDGVVPFSPDLDWTGKYAHRVISPMGRGKLRPVFEQIYNHYVHRVGAAAPFTQQAAEKVRPEGAAQGADHPGFGTLLYSIPAATGQSKPHLAPPAAPAGVIAAGTDREIALSWVASVGAVSYAVKRWSSHEGRTVTIAKGLSSPTYRDKNVKYGELYFYSVTASNAAGSSSESTASSASAGLPAPWSASDIGAPDASGTASYDGRRFTLESAGVAISGASDQCRFAGVPMTGNGAITARFVPQVSSQSSQFGLMIRESTAPSTIQVSLLLTPEPSGSVEKPGWNARLIVRKFSGADAVTAAVGPALAAPLVTYGRLMAPYWLRLARAGDAFTGFVSADGQTWTPIGTTTGSLRGKVRAGLTASSGLAGVATTVVFDSVAAPGWPSLSPR